MPFNIQPGKIKLVYPVLGVLLLVGMVPLAVTGWLLANRSGQELRLVEERYQTQLVQDKARQIEMFAQRYSDLVRNYAEAMNLAQDGPALTSSQNEQKLQAILQENRELLAISINPVQSKPLSLYRTDLISDRELANISNEALGNLGEKKIVWSAPRFIQTGGDMGMAVASPIMDKENSQIVAAVVAVISLSEINGIMEQPAAKSEKELWEQGLPITFVVDERGQTVFHADRQVVAERRLMTNLPIVQEWQNSRDVVQSALFPFTAEQNGEQKKLIGAYSTVQFGDKNVFGVFAIQDEKQAMASVSEMRNQMWFISLGFLGFVVLVGLLLSHSLTKPVVKLVKAAKLIASGDFSTRIQSKNPTELGKLSESFNVMADWLEEHISQLEHAANENHELFVGTVKALAAAIDGKDRYTRGHSERVSRFSVAIGQRMHLDEKELEKLRISALLHDVGKIAIDDAVLKKPAALTDEEFEIMKQHPQKGYKIMSQIPAMKDFLPGMYMHHEMVNGQGYPQGLKGHQIPLQAKIISVADTFDAMTTDRPYQKGMKLDDALARVETFVGTRYDADVVQALVDACRSGQIRPHSASWRTPKIAPPPDVAEIADIADILEIPAAVIAADISATLAAEKILPVS
jgi:HD-GYP domain-containing protein (c-di-GMP phosphodiesterase class II)/gas vesicle protein